MNGKGTRKDAYLFNKHDRKVQGEWERKNSLIEARGFAERWVREEFGEPFELSSMFRDFTSVGVDFGDINRSGNIRNARKIIDGDEVLRKRFDGAVSTFNSFGRPNIKRSTLLVIIISALVAHVSAEVAVEVSPSPMSTGHNFDPALRGITYGERRLPVPISD